MNKEGIVHKKEFGALQSLRGIFALFIFFHHVGWFKAGGDAGVAFFIILSGFVMCHGYGNRVVDKTFNKYRYMRRRLIRVYPLHLVCFVVAIILAPGILSGSGWEAMGLNLVLLQSWVPVQCVFFSGNAVSWCLSDLLFCYAVFPGVMQWLHSHNKSTIAVTASLLLSIYIILLIIIPQQWRLGIIYINPLIRLFDFLAGIALYALWSRTGGGIMSSSTFKSTLLEVSAWLLFVFWGALYAVIPESIGLASWWWPVSAILILVFATKNGHGGVLGVLLSRRWIVKAGELSFSFYMVHQLCIRTVDITLKHFSLSCDEMMRVAVCLTVAVIATWLVHALVEKPASKWLGSTKSGAM